jgi:hypothetical protein
MNESRAPQFTIAGIMYNVPNNSLVSESEKGGDLCDVDVRASCHPTDRIIWTFNNDLFFCFFFLFGNHGWLAQRSEKKRVIGLQEGKTALSR